ncbi:MAG: hypothetical protein AAGK25_09265 [Pseudomonadota bacterium]
MSYAIRIFTHAISMVFRDLGATLRATWVGISLIAASVALILFAAPTRFGSLITQTTLTESDLSGANIGVVALGFLMMVIGYLMMIAAWHRFVLLSAGDRDQGFTPSFGIVMGYLGRSILLGLTVALLAIPAFVPVGIIAGATGSDQIAAFAAIPIFALLGWVLFRLSLILPACTIDVRLTFKDSWQATAPLAGTILGLMILLALADFVLDRAVGLLPHDSVPGGIVSITVSVFYALVSASILTTLYGIAIERREI